MQYLEHVVIHLGDTSAEINTRMALAYLEHIFEEPEDEETRKKFKAFLETSQSYKTERILSQLPTDGKFAALTVNRNAGRTRSAFKSPRPA